MYAILVRASGGSGTKTAVCFETLLETEHVKLTGCPNSKAPLARCLAQLPSMANRPPCYAQLS